MQDNELTFEDVNKHFESIDLSQFKKGGENFFTSDTISTAPADILTKICTIYKVVRPFLALVSNIPLIPKKWRDVIKTFMGLMDGLCP